MELDIRDITITPRATAIPVTVIPRSRATRDALTGIRRPVGRFPRFARND